jgi:hypothetical protein
MVKRALGVAMVLAALGALPAVASADTQDIIAPQHNPPTAADGWQAGTCTETACSPESPAASFFTQAAGHPEFGITQFIVKNEPVLLGGGEEPVGILKDVRVDLPVGLSVNPEATPQCDLASFEAESCDPAATVGVSEVTAALGGVPVGPLPAVVYNLVPEAGHPALFGFRLLGSSVFLKADVEWAGDYHEGFTIAVPESPLGRLLKNRLSFNGRAGNGTFLTNPSTCLDPAQAGAEHVYSTFLRADSVEEPNTAFPNGSSYFEAPLPPGIKPTGCAAVPFKPTIAVDPRTGVTDSPSGPAVSLDLPFEASGTAIANSDVRDANITLANGLGLNPAAAPALVACTDAQLGKGTRNPVGCPAGSRIGTVAIETPPLPPGSLTGGVYLGSQLSRDPQSGNLYRIFLDAESGRYGVSVRLIGNVRANPRTGQLTTTFKENPQVPFTSVKIAFDGGKGVLTSPPTCGPNPSSHALTAWSGSPDQGVQERGFILTSAPGGGRCAKSLAERPFAPGMTAKPGTTAAKKYTPFSLHITRGDGQQEIKGLDVMLPRGATAKLRGVPYCPPADIARAAQRSGAEEQQSPSCPAKSKIGNATVLSGSGPGPLKIGGSAYLAGPYQGAPLSIAVVTPALAGPFDLGNVVVRVPLFLNPETARINPKTNQIPDVFGGAKLDIRSIFVNVNRKRFTLNGSNCRKTATAGAIYGGGADPANPAAFSAVAVSDPFRGTKCRKYRFKPRLYLRLFGKTHRNQHPRLRAVLMARPKNSNIRRAAVALPHTIFLDQASLGTVCTRVQFAASKCPKRSRYGRARALTPLLGKRLEGPVYLRSSNHTLPDLVAHLKGQVTIDLVGRIDTYKGGLRTTFARVPDVPVRKFVMTIPGGRHGLLVSSVNLCAKPVRALVQLKAQNGRRANRHQTIRTPCKKKHGAGGKHRR